MSHKSDDLFLDQLDLNPKQLIVLDNFPSVFKVNKVDASLGYQETGGEKVLASMVPQLQSGIRISTT